MVCRLNKNKMPGITFMQKQNKKKEEIHSDLLFSYAGIIRVLAVSPDAIFRCHFPRACFATSSAKFSSFFSRPSPVSKRTKPFILILAPFAFAT
jgi:hypothetical protein